MSAFNNIFLGQLAVGIWTYDLNSPSNISPLSISGYFISNIGRFDNLTSQCFSAFGFSGLNLVVGGTSGNAPYNYDVVDVTNPSGNMLGDTEGNILRHIYLLTYYEGLIQSFSGPGSFANGINNGNLPVQMLKEGDSTIQFANAAQIMGVYKGILDEKRKELNYMVESYNRNSQGSEIPRTLAFFNIVSPGSEQGLTWYDV